MDTRHDTQLIKRDRKFPGLRILLNPKLFANVLRKAEPETQWGEVKVQHVRYERGVNCLVSYNVETPGATLQMYARAYGGPSARGELNIARENADRARARGSKAYVFENPSISIHHFPDDDKLGTLWKLSRPETRIGLLDDLLAENKYFRKGTIQGLRYRPEQRFVAKVPVKDNAYAVLKVYSERDFIPALNGAEAFTETELYGVPKRLGACPRRLTQVFEWMPGAPLKNVLCSPMVNFGPIRKAGEALAALHAQEVWGLEHSSGEREVDILKADARSVAALCPELQPQLELMVRHIGRRLMNDQKYVRPCHGNFYANKILIENEKVNILDFDKAIFGDPAMDVGLFLAHLDMDVCCHRLSEKDARLCKQIFLEGYGKIMNPPSPSRLETYNAAGLIKLAAEPFRNREPDWFDKMNCLLKGAGEICPEERSVTYGNLDDSNQTSSGFPGQTSAIIEEELVWSSIAPETVQDGLQISCAQSA